jgi:hypothetical protein
VRQQAIEETIMTIVVKITPNETAATHAAHSPMPNCISPAASSTD